MTFEDFLRRRVKTGEVPEVDGREEEWIAEHLTVRHENFHEREILRDGKWLSFRESRLPDGSTIVFRSDITERKLAEEQVKRSLDEKEVLLREIHHRVKNNFQVIASLLSLQAGTKAGAEAAEVLNDSRQRVIAMARAHEHLYSSDDLVRVNARDYLTSVIDGVGSAENPAPRSITIETDLEDILLDGDQALSCGQAVSEMLSNALKHGFAGGRPGKVLVSMRRTDKGNIELTVTDDGVGLPADFDLARTTTLGLRLVDGFAAKLGGGLSVESEGETRLVIHFPEKPQ